MHSTREDWLHHAAELLTPLLQEQGAMVPKIQISTGWTKGGGKKHSIGQCFDKSWTENETFHIFICPTLREVVGDMTNGTHGVLETLLHELIHSAVGIKEKHRGRFKEVAIAVGLEGKMTATSVTAGTVLHDRLMKVAAQLDEYPHAAMVKPEGASKKPAGGGWVKFFSEQAEDYILRVSPKALLTHGVPRDPWGKEMQTDADLELLRRARDEKEAEGDSDEE